jgi:hypothetical protein
MLEENTNEILEAVGKDLRKVGVDVLIDCGMNVGAFPTCNGT